MSNIANLADPTGDQATRVECRATMEAGALSIADVAREIGRGCSQATISQWLAGKYAGDVEAVTARVRRWLDTRAELATHDLSAAGLDRHVPYRHTAPVHRALAYAQAEGDISCVHGRSGAGKTTALKHYAQTRSGAYYVAMSHAVRSVAGMLRDVAEAVDAGDGHRSARDAERAIVASLAGRDALLIVDEAHHLTPMLLDELRCIRDMAGCGLALAGDDTLWTLLAGSRRCDQIVGRIGLRAALRQPSDEDVLDLVMGIVGRRPEGAAGACVLGAARGLGGLHALRRLLARGVTVARSKGHDMDDADIEAAAAVPGA